LLEIVQAAPAEAEAVLALLQQAAQWLRDRGIKQWMHYLDPSAASDLTRAVKAGEVYVARLGGRIVGTMALLPSPGEWDRQLWGDVADDALYVHRLAVDRSAAGAGIGDRMLDWAEGHARATGKRFLRLDCVGHNARLNAYYARRYCGRGQAANIGMSFSRYEKELT
jgi:GNAT superfamily N-acetyltransferase